MALKKPKIGQFLGLKDRRLERSELKTDPIFQIRTFKSKNYIQNLLFTYFLGLKDRSLKDRIHFQFRSFKLRSFKSRI